MLLLIIVPLILDFIFLSLISNRISIIISKIQGSKMKVNMFYATIVYVFICTQLYFIYVNHVSLQNAFMIGASTYGIYEFTNMTLLKDWDYKMAILDTLWGGILYSLSIFIIRNIYYE
jgi:uncharacterized membrane protein